MIYTAQESNKTQLMSELQCFLNKIFLFKIG